MPGLPLRRKTDPVIFELDYATEEAISKPVAGREVLVCKPIINENIGGSVISGLRALGHDVLVTVADNEEWEGKKQAIREDSQFC